MYLLIFFIFIFVWKKQINNIIFLCDKLDTILFFFRLKSSQCNLVINILKKLSEWHTIG